MDVSHLSKSSLIEPGAAAGAVPTTYPGVVGGHSRAILGTLIEVTDREQAICFLDESVLTRRPTRLAFANANLAYISALDPSIARVLAAFVLLNDGVAINTASRLLHGRPFPQNLHGTDLVPEYLDRSNHSLRLFLLGAKPQVVQRACREVERRWPQHRLVGFHDGYFTDDQAASVRSRIAESRADIVLVGMGNPRQERWAAENIPGAAPMAICVGALLDFLAGEVRRAPRWIQMIRMEWAFRMVQEPRRLWRRYTVESVRFARLVFKQYRSRARA